MHRHFITPAQKARAGRHRKRAVVALVSLALTLLGAGVANASLSFGGSEIIVISGFSVQSPVMTTYSRCEGYVDHDQPVLPVTVKATFITAPGVKPTGPYGGLLAWDGGLVSAPDDHFASSAAHAHVQFFHTLAYTNPYDYHGAGTYGFTPFAQDVGVNPALTSIDTSASIPARPPAGAGANVKCTIHRPFNAAQFAGDVAKTALGKLIKAACPECTLAKDVLDAVQGYSDVLNDAMVRAVVDDPPDSDYQQVAQPQPTTLLSPPAGLSSTQQAALVNLESAMAGDIGLARAVQTSENRAWGAINAASRYWYLKQLQAEATYAAQLADALGQLSGLYGDLQAALAPDLPAQFPITFDDANDWMVGYSNGITGPEADRLTQLGASSADLVRLDQNATTIDPVDMVTSDGLGALFAENHEDFAAPLRGLASWAEQAAQEQRPVVSDVSPRTLDAGGGTRVTVTGTNLADTSAIDFGPSTPSTGEGRGLQCTDTQCTVDAPPGSGTVDVVAVGPGGPSAATPADRATYNQPTTPQVTGVFPDSGSSAGGTNVTIHGAGLAGGIVYFGPTAAQSWQCSDTSCSAEAPASVTAGDVDVQVVTGGGTSATSAADVFTYQTSPPPPAQPTVTGVSPGSGDDLGGDTVTITGSGFTNASEVAFGDNPAASYEVRSDTQIVATTPDVYQPQTVDVTVTGPGGASTITPADSFDFVGDPPTISSITPASGSDLGGTPFTISGTHLGQGDGTSIEIGGDSVLDVSCSVTTCTGTTPPGVDGPADVSVYNANVYNSGSATPVLTGAYTYTKGPQPTVDAVTPDTGVVAGGTQVVVTGSNLTTGRVSFGSTYAEGSCTDTVCVATAPAAPKAQTVHVHVTTNAGTSSESVADEYGYVHVARPVVSAVSPASGYTSGGDTMTIDGSNLTGGVVDVGGQQAYGECTATRCVVTAPSAATAGPVHVTVTTQSGSSDATSADEYTYLEAVVTGIAPAHGWTEGGTPVTITGTNLGGSADAPETDASISFGDQDTTGTCTGTSCTVQAPWQQAGTTAVDVRVNPRGGAPSATSSADVFTYSQRPAPTVSSVSPSGGVDTGGTAIVVTGTALTGGSVYVGGRYAGNGCGPTSCSVTTPSSVVGDAAVPVTVQTSVGASPATGAPQFTYAQPGAPTIAGISPDHGSTAGGTAVTIDGTNLTGAVVKLDGIAATGTSCGPTSCTATTPAHPATGTVTVSVSTQGQTGGGGTATTSYTYELPPAPVVTQISPASGPRSGGTPVTMTGTDLLGGVPKIGGTALLSATCTATSCRGIVPAGAVGTDDITVTTAGGTSATGAASTYAYVPVNVSEHAIPKPDNSGNVAVQTGGGGIVRGIGGDVWFTMPSASLIGRISAAGAITSYATPTANAGPTGIATGPDGRMWYAERNADTIVAIDSAGTQTSYPVPGQNGELRFLTAGPDGRIWFDFSASGGIGALDPATGKVSTYHLPDPTVFPYNIVTGPDGRLWFTEVFGSSIGAITTDGRVTEYPLPNGAAEGWGLTVGADNRLWFSETTGGDLGAITTAGKVQSYPVPGNLDDPQGVLSGPDGRIWFTAPDTDEINALDPVTGSIDQYALPPGYPAGEAPRYLAMDGSGTLWVTENIGSRVLSVDGLTSPVAPTVLGVAPDHGDAGTQVSISGSNFTTGATVSFGGVPASSVSVTDPAHLTATAPAGSGIVDVTVTTIDGTSATSAADRFSYGAAIEPMPTVTGVAPDSGPVTGGSTVTITGTDLGTGTAVSFGSTPATGVSCTAAACTAVAPAGSAGPVDVTVTTAGGTSAATDADRFVYLTAPPARPTVTGVTPGTGSAAGGDTVTVTGTDLANGSVTFGLVSAADASCTSTTCTVTAPTNGAGPVDVRVTTDGGTSARTSADTFTYVASTKVPTTATLVLGGPGISTVAGGYSAVDGVGYVNLTATVSPRMNGSVTFYDGTTALGTVPMSSGYAFTYESRPSLGTHAFRAEFTPLDDAFYASSTGTATLNVAAQLTPSSISVTAPSRVLYGATMSVGATLKDAATGHPIAAATVDLYRRTSPSAAWSHVGRTTTSATGTATIRYRASTNVQLQWRFGGDATRAPATSATRSVAVAQVVLIATPQSSVRHGRALVIYGTVKPAGAGQRVTLQMKVGGAWRSVASAVLKRQQLPDHTTRVGYRFTRTLSRTGRYQFRVVKAATSSLAAGVSRTTTIRIT